MQIVIKGRRKSSDPDGDSINYLYQWEKNEIVLSGEETDILSQTDLKKETRSL